MSIETLTPAPYNPRKLLKPTDPAWVKLETSLREFGLVEPLIWNEATGHVVGGHTRLRILKQLGVTEVPVSVVRLSPEREKALNVVLNNREAQGQYDTDKLTTLLEELDGLPEMEMTGFDEADLRAMRLGPLTTLAPLEESDKVEIELCVPREQYDRVASRLDDLL